MDKLAETYFFKDLSSAELETLSRVTKIQDAKKDQLILSQGEVSDDLFIVRTGSVRVLIPTPEGIDVETADQTLVVLGPGECFGEFAFVDRKPVSASVRAKEDSTVYAIAFQKLDEALRGEPETALKIYKALLHILVSRFRNTDIELAMRRAIGD